MANNRRVIYMLSEQTGVISVQDKQAVAEFMLKEENKYRGLRLNVILQEAEVLNNNRRIYDKPVLVRAMKEYEPVIKRGHALMESGHPITKDPQRFRAIVMNNSVARINGYKWNGNLLEGEMETLLNQAGKDYKSLLLQEGFVGATSLRAMGGVTKVGNVNRVNQPIKIIGYDVVLNQSHENAVVQNAITESEILEYIENKSENMDALRESLTMELGYTPDIITESNGATKSYDAKDNSVIICENGSCLKVFLEESITKEFDDLIASYR